MNEITKEMFGICVVGIIVIVLSAMVVSCEMNRQNILSKAQQDGRDVIELACAVDTITNHGLCREYLKNKKNSD